jgi:hypothetical protein
VREHFERRWCRNLSFGLGDVMLLLPASLLLLLLLGCGAHRGQR